MKNRLRARQVPVWVGLGMAVLAVGNAFGQFGPPPGPSGPAREVAPIDLTGQWVSIVTEDWRFRMVTPPKNDYPGLPLNQAAQAVADQWDPERDVAEGNECKAYGVGGIVRMPGRLRIDWDGNETLRLQFDAGRQTRLLHFDDAVDAPAEATWQGYSEAEWEIHSAGFRAPPAGGNLKVVTTNMREGYFRKNGVPYSEGAVLTEYFDLLTQHDGTEWLVVLSVLDDPQYYTTPIITSTNFRRESDRRGWNPTDCRVD
jgi:hypothetical protein